MDNALLISLSQQTALQRRMDVIANNMANMGTAGYKADSLLFEEFVMPVARVDGVPGASARLSYVQDGGVFRNMEAGSVVHSGAELDVAISGDGWFVIQTPEGARYTRNGQFKLDAQGQLVTGAGDPVLGQAGPIVFGPDEAGIEIAQDGTISTTQGPKDRLQIVQFANPLALKKADAATFTAEEAPLPATGARLMQGMYEASNVQPIVEMTRMIETVRAYSHIASTLQNADDLRRDAIQRLGTTPE